MVAPSSSVHALTPTYDHKHWALHKARGGERSNAAIPRSVQAIKFRDQGRAPDQSATMPMPPRLQSTNLNSLSTNSILSTNDLNATSTIY